MKACMLVTGLNRLRDKSRAVEWNLWIESVVVLILVSSNDSTHLHLYGQLSR